MKSALEFFFSENNRKIGLKFFLFADPKNLENAQQYLLSLPKNVQPEAGSKWLESKLLKNVENLDSKEISLEVFQNIDILDPIYLLLKSQKRFTQVTLQIAENLDDQLLEVLIQCSEENKVQRMKLLFTQDFEVDTIASLASLVEESRYQKNISQTEQGFSLDFKQKSNRKSQNEERKEE